MTATHVFEEERLGRLIGLLEPAPPGWALAAQEIPGLSRTLDEILARAGMDASSDAELLAGLEAALEKAGYEPEPRLVAALRRRLGAH
jgi:hypothetical protein